MVFCIVSIVIGTENNSMKAGILFFSWNFHQYYVCGSKYGCNYTLLYVKILVLCILYIFVTKNFVTLCLGPLVVHGAGERSL